jgi:hypothetical protein
MRGNSAVLRSQGMGAGSFAYLIQTVGVMHLQTKPGIHSHRQPTKPNTASRLLIDRLAGFFGSVEKHFQNLVAGAAFSLPALGLAPFAEKQANADLVVSLEALPGVLDAGRQGTVAMGGNGVWLRLTAEDGSVLGLHGSGLAFNYGGFGHVYTAGHTILAGQAQNATFSIGTGWNFNTHPGDIYTPEFIRLAPGYDGPGTIGSAMDLAYMRFSTEIAGAGELYFPTETGHAVGRGYLTSFGRLGVLDGEWGPQTGDAYGGWATARPNDVRLFGANPDLYSVFRMSLSDPTSTRASNGSSGGGVTQDQLFNDTIRRVALGLATQAQGSTFGPSHQIVRFDSADFRNFHSENMSMVPEPGSGVLLSVGSLLALTRTRRRAPACRMDTCG